MSILIALLAMSTESFATSADYCEQRRVHARQEVSTYFHRSSIQVGEKVYAVDEGSVNVAEKTRWENYQWAGSLQWFSFPVSFTSLGQPVAFTCGADYHVPSCDRGKLILCE